MEASDPYNMHILVTTDWKLHEEVSIHHYSQEANTTNSCRPRISEKDLEIPSIRLALLAPWSYLGFCSGLQDGNAERAANVAPKVHVGPLLQDLQHSTIVLRLGVDVMMVLILMEHKSTLGSGVPDLQNKAACVCIMCQ